MFIFYLCKTSNIFRALELVKPNTATVLQGNERWTIVFDIDGTLLECRDEATGINEKLVVHKEVIALRPGLFELLTYCLSKHNVVLWSAGHHSYVSEINELLFAHTGSRCQFSQENCHIGESYVYKILRYEGLDTLRTITVDDREDTASYNEFAHFIRVREFLATDPTSHKDIVLSQVLNTIETIVSENPQSRQQFNIL